MAAFSHSGFTHSRPELAHAYCNALSGNDPLQDRRAGLFLTAPPGTGKTLFIHHDLLLEMERRDWYPITIDLRAPRHTSPRHLLQEGLANELVAIRSEREKSIRAFAQKHGEHRPPETQWAYSADSESNTHISDLTRLLASSTGKSIGLVLDEAQQLTLYPEYRKTMAELKTARGNMYKVGKDVHLFLVFVGSVRHGLSRMVSHKSDPFYGAQILNLPLLGDAFVKEYTDWVNGSLVDPEQFALSDMTAVFRQAGSRPGELKRAVGYALSDASKSRPVATRLAEGAKRLRHQRWEAYDRLYGDLKAFPRVVLDRLMAQGEEFQPFVSTNCEHYAMELGLSEPVKPPRIQRALSTLMKHGLLWSPGRGVYMLEDPAMAEWHSNCNNHQHDNTETTQKDTQ